jgi:hypothetical protein
LLLHNCFRVVDRGKAVLADAISHYSDKAMFIGAEKNNQEDDAETMECKGTTVASWVLFVQGLVPRTSQEDVSGAKGHEKARCV